MGKQAVYLETSIASYLCGRPSRDLVVAARQQVTRDWWDVRREHFEVYVSQLVHDEAARGNYKSLLQQYAQEHFNVAPIYVLLDEKGPNHNKCFESAVVLDQRHFTSAWGPNKKQAEQKAAHNALVELGVLQRAAADDDAYKAE